MTTQILNFTLYKGITFAGFLLTFNDDAGQPVDLTGWQVEADARAKEAAPVAFSLNPTIADAGAGQVLLASFTDEESNVLPAGRFHYDVVLLTPAGERLGPLVKGNVLPTFINTRPV